MMRILIVHDGKPLRADAKNQLLSALQKAKIVDILYIIPQNLVHYGQVDTLASPICKDDFIKYVQDLGIEECKNALTPLVDELKQMFENLEIKLHVRWGNAAKAIEELSNKEVEGIFVQQNSFNINWLAQKKSSLARLADILHIL